MEGTNMKLFILLAALFMISAPLFSCGGSEEDDDDDDWWDDDDGGDLDDFLNAMPDPANLALSLPAPDSVEKGLGDLAELYQETVQFTTEVNENVLMFLSWIDEITSYPPSAHEGDAYTWGPWEAGGLYGGEYRFIMTRTGEESFEYTMQGRTKGSEDPWIDVWYGQVDVSDAETERRGIGSYTVDFDAASSIELWMVEEGLVVVTYDTVTDGRQIDIEYDGFKPDDEDYQDYLDGLYKYHNHADDSGEFTFDVLADMHYDEYHGEQYSKREHFWFNTRWFGDGRGRSDVLVNDGDLPDIEIGGIPIDKYILGECWGTDFMRDYWIEVLVLEDGSESVLAEEGVESDCSFEQQLPEAD